MKINLYIDGFGIANEWVIIYLFYFFVFFYFHIVISVIYILIYNYKIKSIYLTYLIKYLKFKKIRHQKKKVSSGVLMRIL